MSEPLKPPCGNGPYFKESKKLAERELQVQTNFAHMYGNKTYGEEPEKKEDDIMKCHRERMQDAVDKGHARILK